MKFTTKTEYGLICLIYMARHSHEQVTPITIRELAKAEQFSVAYTEKILQTLRLSGIVTSVQGNHGGYVLARPSEDISLREIVEALEGQTFDVFCSPDLRTDIICNHFPSCGVMPVWEKTKELLDSFFGSVSLETMASHDLKTKLSELEPLHAESVKD